MFDCSTFISELSTFSYCTKLTIIIPSGCEKTVFVTNFYQVFTTAEVMESWESSIESLLENLEGVSVLGSCGRILTSDSMSAPMLYGRISISFLFLLSSCLLFSCFLCILNVVLLAEHICSLSCFPCSISLIYLSSCQISLSKNYIISVFFSMIYSVYRV